MNTNEQHIHSMVESFGVAWIGTVRVDDEIKRVKAFREDERKQAFEWASRAKDELKGQMTR